MVFDRLPDQIIYIAEDEVTIRQLKFADVSEEVRSEFGFSQQKAEEYHRQQWEKNGVFQAEARETGENMRILQEIVAEYPKKHTYSKQEDFECVDMANDVWDQVKHRGIPAKIGVGNLDKDIKSLFDANHAWVMAEVSPGMFVALEPQTGEIISPAAKPRYYSGHCFPGPKEVKEYKRLKEHDYRAALLRRAKAAEEYKQAEDKLSGWDRTALPVSTPAGLAQREFLAADERDKKAVLEEREADLAELRERINALLAKK